MRVITGSARGVRLDTLDGLETRPTPEKVKEALFSMIQFDIEGRRVLDLFSGSGQLGIEALSRGAAHAVMVDSNPAAVNIIKKNAQKAKVYESSTVLTSDWRAYLRGASGRERFDIVLLDPPFSAKLLPEAVDAIIKANILSEHALMICESEDDNLIEAETLRTLRRNKYGRIRLTLLTNEPEESENM